MSDNALMVQGGELTIPEMKAQIDKIQQLMRDIMADGIHYGVIPGTTKPTLYKAGAEKLGFVFRLRPEFDITREDMTGGHREYEVVCKLYHMSTGAEIAQGVGNCSTMESKYRYRQAKRVCPACEQETIIKGKKEYGGGWICFKKKGGCGMKYADDDSKIIGQKIGQVENADIADCYNTVKKMAKKRAHVDSVITACAASDIFTQDVEDFKSNSENGNQSTKESEDNKGVDRKTDQNTKGKKTDNGRHYTDKEIKADCRRGIAMLSKLLKDKTEIGQMIDHLETSNREDTITMIEALKGKIAAAQEAQKAMDANKPTSTQPSFNDEDSLKGTPGEVHRTGPAGAIRAD